MSDPNAWGPFGHPGQPPPRNGPNRIALIVIAAAVLVVGVVVGVLVTLAISDDDDGSGPSAPPTTTTQPPKKLSHLAVEHYIEQNLGASDVQCNDGLDYVMRNNGDSFRCTDGAGMSYTVTIKDKSDGTYVVQ